MDHANSQGNKFNAVSIWKEEHAPNHKGRAIIETNQLSVLTI